jgi:transcriptional regulator with XRE-family HTH domain
MDEISQRITELLDSMGKTQSWLSEKSGVGRTTLNNWINNGASPKVKDLVNIAMALGVSLEWLATGSDNLYENYSLTHTKLVHWILSLSENEAIGVDQSLSGIKKYFSNDEEIEGK